MIIFRSENKNDGYLHDTLCIDLDQCILKYPIIVDVMRYLIGNNGKAAIATESVTVYWNCNNYDFSQRLMSNFNCMLQVRSKFTYSIVFSVNEHIYQELCWGNFLIFQPIVLHTWNSQRSMTRRWKLDRLYCYITVNSLATLFFTQSCLNLLSVSHIHLRTAT